MALGRQIQTPRLLLEAVNWRDMEDMARLKADAGAFGKMLGGVRSRAQAEEEMADDLSFWARRGVGIFSIRENDVFLGMTGVHERPDGRGLGLRFALRPVASGRGIAREAAGAALRFVLDAGEPRVVAVSREDNMGSRIVLGSIGMHHADTFERDGYTMLVYEIVRPDMVTGRKML
ncbi:acetyltransferase [Neoasaia chiangmaiensis NBRC 101099]|uniref:Acetyltransferase n=1 Tax=Neoasaia chiangmaiensis TaxID=320497 RepID=A0A1U9KP00_9PROT|nr:GNAT family N-acetyltransferase [Neoasaia chiangmaiensis]AQS87483.1 acetyltransferase [Neoasaia chiangmaiensis]GBR42542.1 acetyltransferase [Neoasaia chiangmaiensis NBRC 101099]GEN16276.1 acetyltransferase [Neoasaia chiangmaiensis]